MLRRDAEPVSLNVRVPKLGCGRYSVTAWSTREGRSCAKFEVEKGAEPLLMLQVPPFTTDLALAIRRCELRLRTY
jgi:mannan endo-1,4-beta-mannosidase